MEPRGRSKRKAFDSLEYLKFALSNCRKNRLKNEYLARSEETKIKAVNTKGSIFYYSVTNSNNSDDSDTESSDSDDDDDDDEDEITNHLKSPQISLNKPENFQDFLSDFHSKDELISGLENHEERNQETNLDNLFHFEDMQINEMWINDFENNDSAMATQFSHTSSQQQELLNFAENLMSDMTKDLPNSNLTGSTSNAESIEEFTQNLGTLPDGDDLYKYAEICDSAAFFSSTVDEFISEFSAMTLNQ